MRNTDNINVIYVASTCSRHKYYDYVEKYGERVSQQAQKYNILLAEGLSKNDMNVQLISTRPISRKLTSKVWFGYEKENEAGILFKYVPFLNFPAFRSIFLFLGVVFMICQFNGTKKDTVVVCDTLNITAAFAVVIACFFKRLKKVAIVTDIPCHFSRKEPLFYEKINLFIIKLFDGFLLLTEAMNKIVNPMKKPSLVMEGHVDETTEYMKRMCCTNKQRVCLYAGTIQKVYGIKNLVEGFIKANISGLILNIYGNGDYEEELKIVAEQHNNINYLGVVSNKEVLEAQQEAILLINPRPTDQEYTKYSFPSKNMEYLVSGTPVLTTMLPGMPEDHLPYVFLIENESADGIAQALKSVFSYSEDDLINFGLRAREFAIKEKGNVKQASKLKEFIISEFKLTN